MSANGTGVLEPAQMQALAIPTRKPTGRPSWPLILIEGGEKTGKTWAAAELTSSRRFTAKYWIDIGEGSADEYAAIPGADYEIVLHDGTFDSLYQRVEQIHTFARHVHEAGDKPVLLVIDQMTAEWDVLKQEAHSRAVQSPTAQRKLARDPGAEISIPMNLWNDATERHYRLMRLLQTFRGIVVMIARGKEIAGLDDNGRPTGERTYRVEGHKNLAFDASCWIRLSRQHPPMVIGARSVHHGLRPGVDEPRKLPGMNLEHVAFEVLLGGTVANQVRDIGQEPAWENELKAAQGNFDELSKLWAKASNYSDDDLPRGFRQRLKAAGTRAKHAQTRQAPEAQSTEIAQDESEVDPDSDDELCPGSGIDAGRWGYTTVAKDDGSELVLCQNCDQLRRLRAGKVEDHGANAPRIPGTEAVRTALRHASQMAPTAS
ncbi:hypothetical protein MOQ72_26980 [Saccharopolyspora sp. K220]|uniref:hypothetical protein n=1 Tax=Saccharopolyspora soli TaxID=2926618 RepID=UPI001F57B665|nr:hypothetical protein [Saccharopolyspora soli]MCI2421093.1 hypothetical protein [Saccharopolyspora soli]